MNRKTLSAITALLMLAGMCAPLGAYSIQYRDNGGVRAQRWVSNPIIIAFSTSLNSPPPNIKAGSDLIGATRRALQHWSNAANIHFFETTSDRKSTRLNSSHSQISYAAFCLKKKQNSSA